MPSDIPQFKFRSAILRTEIEANGLDPDLVAKEIVEAIAPYLLDGVSLSAIEKILKEKLDKVNSPGIY